MSCVYAYALLLCWLVFKRVGFDVRVWFKFDLPCDVVWLSFFVVVVFVMLYGLCFVLGFVLCVRVLFFFLKIGLNVFDSELLCCCVCECVPCLC